ncbi:MAG: DUF3305 domain-containing protein, partial [Alphaproteobacteria bacterium]
MGNDPISPLEQNSNPRSISVPVGVVLLRQPGKTRWVKWSWKAVAVMPGAPPTDWKVLRKDGDKTEFHAATMALELHRTDVEAYRVSLSMTPPSIFVILRDSTDNSDPHDVVVHGVTASAFEAQDYLDSGEEVVEAVPIPEG